MKTRDKKADEDAATVPFQIARGVLTANGDLFWEFLEEFESACDLLLSSRKSVLTLDFTGVNFISSSFVGCLSNLLVKASRQGKKIVFKVTRDVGWLFDIMGGHNNMSMEVV